MIRLFNPAPKTPYVLHRSRKRRRTLAMYVGPEEQLHILAPMRASVWSIERFIRQRTGWIDRQMEKARQQRALRPARTFQNGDRQLFQGKEFILRVTQNPDAPQNCVLDDAAITVNLREASESDDAQREEVRLELLLWYKKQARKIIEQRLQHWSDELDLKYRRFTLTNAQRLWGSCTGHNDIRIHWRLIMAPPHLLDYVIVHELAHIAHKDHSPRFWRRVESALPGCKKLRHELRAMSAALML